MASPSFGFIQTWIDASKLKGLTMTNATHMPGPWRTLAVPHTANFTKNNHKPKNGYPCVVCGKECETHKQSVHLIEGGAAILHPQDEALYKDDGGDMGFYPVGNDCVKKFNLKEWSKAHA